MKKFKNVGAGPVSAQRGITLIALVITIIVMLILVAVTINMAINGGLFEKAGEAVGDTQNAINKEQELADGKIQADGLWYDSIDDYLAGNYSGVTNPYDEDGWVMAWTCTDGVWSDTIQAGETAEGDIVAKLYETGNKIKPDGFTWSDTGQTFTFNEGNEYKLVIEGQGEMGALMTTDGTDITAAFAWHAPTVMYMMGASDTCIIPYVSEIVVCDGITNIGDYAFNGDTSLTKLTMTNTITKIGVGSFMYNTNLSSTKLPNDLANIGYGAFWSCTSLTSITYQGTQAEWNNVSSGYNSSWNAGSFIKTIVCTDGEITLQW